MKYQVTGSNRETGARMILEFEADSKAAAQRKATQQGMDVRFVQDLSDASDQEEPVRRRSGLGIGWLIRLVGVLIVLAVGWQYFGARILEALGR